MDSTVKPSTRLGTPPSTTFARCFMTCCPTFQIRTCKIRLLHHTLASSPPNCWLSLSAYRVCLSHIGGDEVSTACWAANPAVKAWLAERKMDVGDLQSYFEHELVGIARNEMQKDVIVWQEVRKPPLSHCSLQCGQPTDKHRKVAHKATRLFRLHCC